MRAGSDRKGKRGGYRILYVDFPSIEKIYLLVIYPKNEQEDISSDEKKVLTMLVEKLRKELGA